MQPVNAFKRGSISKLRPSYYFPLRQLGHFGQIAFRIVCGVREFLWVTGFNTHHLVLPIENLNMSPTEHGGQSRILSNGQTWNTVYLATLFARTAASVA